MKKIVFMRTDRRQLRGYIADVPMAIETPVATMTYFIVVRAEDSEIPEELLTNNTVRLDLDKLILEYPDEQKTRLNIEGVEEDYTEYGYFSELGTSTINNQPMITMADIMYDEIPDPEYPEE